MATISDGELYLEIEGANEQELKVGLRAVRQVVEEAECSIESAFEAYSEREGANIFELLEITPAVVFERAGVIDAAMHAAVDAATSGWPKRPRLRSGIALRLMSAMAESEPSGLCPSRS